MLGNDAALYFCGTAIDRGRPTVDVFGHSGDTLLGCGSGSLRIPATTPRFAMASRPDLPPLSVALHIVGQALCPTL
jgi:hypothetical protein